METFWQDARYALRSMMKKSSFTAVVALTLALGIGANTAIFSLIYGILLRPFPYADPDRPVKIESVYTKTTGSVQGASQLDIDDWQRHTRSFDNFGLHITYPAILNTGGGPSQSVRLTFVTARMFDTLSVNPIVGRNFKPEEDIIGGDVLKAVLSYGLWQTTFGGDRNVVGRVIRLRGATYTIIGGAPPGFRFPERSDIWVPLQARYAGYKFEFWKGRDFRPHTAVARLKSGVTLAQAQSEMNTLAAQLEREFPTTNQGVQLRLTPLRDAEVGNVRLYLWLLLGAVVMVVIIVSRHTAETLWPGREAIGQKLLVGKLSATNVWHRVIGVVGDTKWHAAETGKGFEVYYSHRQWPVPAFHPLLRTEGDPASLIPQVRRVIHEVNPDIAINEIQPMDEVVSEALWQRRLWGVLFALFAGVALLLAAVGIYGVMSYLVSQRTREIGVRIALGAQTSDVLRLIVGQGLKVVAIGVAIGLLAALALSRVVKSLLFDVTATDPLTFAGVALIACFIPARRAAKTDPIIALKYE